MEGVWAEGSPLRNTYGLHELFYFLFYVIKLFMFESLPYEPRKIEATEAVLERIYLAAKKGLKGDTLAYAAGLTPQEYRRLTQLDPIAEYAEQKGRAEGEAEMSEVLHKAAREGDTKAALDILKHVHKWTAPQSVQVQIEQRISILAALEEATTRVIEGSVLDTVEAVDAGTSDGLLDNRNRDGSHAQNYARQTEKSIDL